MARTGWQPAEVLRVAKILETRKALALLGQPTNLFVSTQRFQALAQRAIDQLEQFHKANPLVAGLPKEELRGRLPIRWAGQIRLPSPTLLNAVIQALASQGKLSLQGETIRLSGREIQLTAEETAARDHISHAFEKAGLAVPSAKEVLATLHIDRARAEKLLHLLLKEKVLVRVSEDLIFHRSALVNLRQIVAQRKARSNRIDVPVFKEITGLSRKYAIPLLEYLDRERVTRRQGDERVIL